MKQELLDALQAVKQPDLINSGFIQDLKAPLEYTFEKNDADGFLAQGISFNCSFPDAHSNVETAFTSLRRVLKAKNIPVLDDNAYPINIRKDDAFAHEEYELTVTPDMTAITAADPDGLRRAIYFLEDKLCERNDRSATVGSWRRRPFVKNRISRCFFGPTYRPPFFVDELMNDIDYYPEEYLNKLAHEGVNGLWLTMYFKDFPSSIFPENGKGAEQRLAKLRKTVAKCLRYGIRIFVFFSEPKGFGDNPPHCLPFEVAQTHPELLGLQRTFGTVKRGSFCTSNETAQTYFREALTALFSAVPDLGGVINITFGEDNGACVCYKLHWGQCECPVCSKRDNGDIIRQSAKTMADAIHAINPDADYIAWFYNPSLRKGSPQLKALAQALQNWPEDCVLMTNFESGGLSVQLDKTRTVFDYSLAFIGPSDFYRDIARKTRRMGAKLQVGCSHEDASVPFIPVPSNLYEKYKAMNGLNVCTVMQCWYFGNYPGLMNKAAGELSFLPFPASEDEFLARLAAPIWREYAPQAVQAWKHFAAGYRNFPANIGFAWYGPLHHAICWPLYLFPADTGLTPSWLLRHFPEISGDRIGETLLFHHTLAEGLELCERMRDEWLKGFDILNSVKDAFKGSQARQADISLAHAILLQIKSTCNVLKFYSLREEMLYARKDNLEQMRQIVIDEIDNSETMCDLCLADKRLGYHSEAEGYLFFPERLQARINCLKDLLENDFPKFNLKASWIPEYTGEVPNPLCMASCPRNGAYGPEHNIPGTNVFWAAASDGEFLSFKIRNHIGKHTILEIEPCRMWIAAHIDLNERGDDAEIFNFVFRQPQTITVTMPDASTSVIKLPLAMFDGFRRPGFPMRVNVINGESSWAPGEPWPSRLTHLTYNPNRTGWLVL